MKFTIKTSAVAVSDSKFAKRGEYETEDEKEIERLRTTAKKFPQDVEEVSGHGSKKKEEPKEEKEETSPSEESTDAEEHKEETHRRRR